MARSTNDLCQTEMVVERALLVQTLQLWESEEDRLRVHLPVREVLIKHPKEKKRADTVLHGDPTRARGRPQGGESVHTRGHLHGESDEEGGHTHTQGRLHHGGTAMKIHSQEESGAHLHIMVVTVATRGEELMIHDLSFLPSLSNN